MSTRKDGGEEEGWLNLRLGQNEGSSCVRSRSTSMKVYACSFCGRKLHSPQALGGHQNAHRRERDSARRYPASFQVKQSTDVDSHLLARTPGTDDETTVARFADNGAGYGVASVQLYAAERAVDLKSSGSSYSYPEPSSDQFDPNTLDLNLKL